MRLLALWLGCAAPPDALPLGATSADCEACHAVLAAEWAGSAHGRSTGSPVFAALLPEVEAAWGPLARQTCEGCHAPGHADEDTIGCVSCHAAVGNHGEADGRLAIDLDAPLAGPLGDRSEPTAAHRSAPRALLNADSLCGTCHEVTGPGLFVEHTLTDFRASPAAAAGEGCVDCHAPPVAERPWVEGGVERPSRDHRFVGVDPPWGADAATAEAAAAATRALYAEALRLELEHTDAGRALVLRNVGAGHPVPTGVAFLRDLRVEVEVDGVPWPEPVLRLGDRPMAGDRPVALPTDADRIEAGSLAPGASLRAALPASGHGRAVLRARAVRPEVMEALALEAWADELVDHEVAVVEW